MFGRSRNTTTVPGAVDSQLFKYRAVAPDGSRRTATMAAPNQAAVVRALLRDNWTPLDVTPVRKSVLDVDLTAWITGGGVKLTWRERAEFARRLHQMLRAGISMPKSLQAFAEDATKDVAQMCTDLAERVLAGESLSESMARYPRAFDEVTVAYAQSGEESGTLVTTTGRLAQMLANRAAVQSKIRGVTAYPKAVGAAIGALVMGIIMFLVPRYEKIYAGFGSELPAPTQALVWVSEHFLPVSLAPVELFGFSGYLIRPEPLHVLSWVLYALVGWWVFRYRTKDNDKVGEQLDRIKFRSPVLGKLWALQAMQRWAVTLAGGLASGVPIPRALELAAAASGSRWHASIVPALVERVRSGRSLSSEMVNHKDLYPPSVRTMVSTGEDTGELDEMLDSVSTALESDIDATIAGLSAKIEVALLIALGLVVGGLLIVLYLPILNLTSVASEGLSSGSAGLG